MMAVIILVIVLFTASFADAVPAHPSFRRCSDFLFSANPGKNNSLLQLGSAIPKTGRIVAGYDVVWGENAGWINLRAAHSDLKIGANILAGWVWLENCGWVCLGEGHPLDGKGYSNRSACDWGVNNNGQGNLSGYAWSEVTGWINFRTSYSRVYLYESGQFYGYAWGENVGWMHFGPGRTVQYLAKADPGPWRDIGPESEDRLVGCPNDSVMGSGCVPVTSLNINYRRYNIDAWIFCVVRLERDDFCDHIRCSNIPIYISSLATLSPIRAPPTGRKGVWACRRGGENTKTQSTRRMKW